MTTMKGAFILSSIIFLTLLFFKPFHAISIFFGTLWGCVNLFFLNSLLQNLLGKPRDYFATALLLMLKFPAVYVVGLIVLNQFSPCWLLVGFSFVIISILSLGFSHAKRHYG